VSENCKEAIRDATEETTIGDEEAAPSSENTMSSAWKDTKTDEKPVAFGLYFLWGHGNETRGGPECPECGNTSMCFFRKGEKHLGKYKLGADCDMCSNQNRKRWFQCGECGYDLCSKCAYYMPETGSTPRKQQPTSSENFLNIAH